MAGHASMAPLMARVTRVLGNGADVLRYTADAITRCATILEEDRHTVVAVLDDPAETRVWLERLCQAHPEVAIPADVLWFPAQAMPDPFPHKCARDEVDGVLGPAWAWHDPLGSLIDQRYGKNTTSPSGLLIGNWLPPMAGMTRAILHEPGKNVTM
jgi:hypothetical protein